MQPRKITKKSPTAADKKQSRRNSTTSSINPINKEVRKMSRKKWITMGAALGMIMLADRANALELGEHMTEMKVAMDTVWVVMCAALVFFMNTGFALLEAGLCRSKNTVNILSKNVIVFGVAALAFWTVGFGLMFGDGNSLIGTCGWFLSGPDNSPAVGDAYRGIFSALNWTGIPLDTKFLFQMVFAATAATIVSGTVAERIKYYSFIVFSILLVAFIYPVTGHWIWGGGWLGGMGFTDFAGSCAVHSVGGWAALTGSVILGARLGKFGKDIPIWPPAPDCYLPPSPPFLLSENRICRWL
jgi:Amt family ammonium transporter